MHYIFLITLTNLTVIAFNFAFSDDRSLLSLLMISMTTFGATAAVIALDAITAFLIRKLPEKWFRPDAPLFTVGKRERRIYKKINLKWWTGKVPELGGLTGFHKDKLEDPKDPRYLRRFLLEANYGMAIHFVNAFCGVLLPFLPFVGKFEISVPIGIVNFILSILPMCLLRNNTPVLLMLYRRAEAKEQREENETASVHD